MRDQLNERREALRIVAEGYDRIAERYAKWLVDEVTDDVRPKYVAALIERLPAKADVLELGCGGGGPTTRQLAERYILTGVDISGRQVQLARGHLPNATFIHADMSSVSFRPCTYDGVVAFHSLIHLPHGDLPELVGKIGTWLRPGGVFVASMGVASDQGTLGDWLGATMYFSGYPVEANRTFVERSGLEIVADEVETIREQGQPQSSHWVIARKPDDRAPSRS